MVLAWTFPVYLTVGELRIHPHLLFELLAYAIGFQLYRRGRRRQGDVISTTDRWTVITAAVLGAAAGSKLLAWANDPVRTWQTAVEHPLELLGGKTIVGGILGGWIAVEWIKRRIGVTRSTGDLFVIPLAVGIAIGRIGCFLTGLDDHTHGVATSLPWGVDFGDGVARHPTQLYEIGFLLALATVLARVEWGEGARFRAFVGGYLAFRLLVDTIKPDGALLGLSGIQWACAISLAWLAFGRRR